MNLLAFGWTHVRIHIGARAHGCHASGHCPTLEQLGVSPCRVTPFLSALAILYGPYQVCTSLAGPLPASLTCAVLLPTLNLPVMHRDSLTATNHAPDASMPLLSAPAQQLALLADPLPLPFARALPANDANVPQSGPYVSTDPSMQLSPPTPLSAGISCAFPIPSLATLTLDCLPGVSALPPCNVEGSTLQLHRWR